MNLLQSYCLFRMVVISFADNLKKFAHNRFLYSTQTPVFTKHIKFACKGTKK